MVSSTSLLGIFPVLILVFYVVLAVLIIYCLILFIRLAHRGITALDMYINDKSNRR